MRVIEHRITKGYYGQGEKFPCVIFVYGNFYAIKGARRIFETENPGVIFHGVDLETVVDIGVSDTKEPIDSLKDLKALVTGGGM